MWVLGFASIKLGEMRRDKLFSCVALMAAASAAAAGCPSQQAFDVVIFGSTPAGFAAAMAAKNASGGHASVLLLEPTAYVGKFFVLLGYYAAASA